MLCTGFGSLTIFPSALADVRQRAEDPGALDVEDGVPPPRAAPPLLRRVVLSCALYALPTTRRGCSGLLRCQKKQEISNSVCLCHPLALSLPFLSFSLPSLLFPPSLHSLLFRIQIYRISRQFNLRTVGTRKYNLDYFLPDELLYSKYIHYEVMQTP